MKKTLLFAVAALPLAALAQKYRCFKTTSSSSKAKP